MKRIRLLIMTSILMLAFTTMSFAAMVDSSLTAEQKSWLQSNVTVENGKIVAPDNNVKSKMTLTRPENSDYCQEAIGDTVVYWKSTNDKALGASITRATNNNDASKKMEGLTNNLDISADTAGAGVMLSGLQPVINLALGIIATLIMFGMAISTSLDLCYIAFPTFRNKAEDAKTSGNSMMTRKNSNGDTSLRWVTDDAQYAISSTVTEGTGRSPYSVYFKKRVASYIFLTIIMFILLTGNITLITDIALKIVSGVLEVLQGLA